MAKRLLSATADELLNMNKDELLSSIEACEGRVIVSEIIGESSLYTGISNAEVAASFGADLLLLNLYDVYNPKFANVNPTEGQTVIDRIKELTGRPVGVNLEPVDKEIGDKEDIAPGRQANQATAKKVVEQGADFIVLTGNPETGVTNQEIIKQIEKVSNAVGNEAIIIAGKMHMAGVKEKYLEASLIKKMIAGGADIILLPTPGTVPGVTVEEVRTIVQQIHQAEGMAMNAIGTSQESANEEIIQKLALNSKLTGADIHHIGDAGYHGIAIPENITAYSTAIRGKRHTQRRMSVSTNRKKIGNEIK